MSKLPEFLIPPEPRFDPKTLMTLKRMTMQVSDWSKINEALIKQGFSTDIARDLVQTASQFEMPKPKVFCQQLIDPETCQQWLQRLALSETKNSKTVIVNDQGENTQQLSATRITENVDITRVKDEFIELINDLLLSHCRQFFGLEFARFQYPQLLRYNQGGKYESHSDSEYFEPTTQLWIPCLDRDVSLLCYLDQSYQGGELAFEHFDIRIKPTTGMVVAFPSHYIYQHQSTPIMAGTKHVIVSWCKAVGSPQYCDSEQNQHMIELF